MTPLVYIILVNYKGIEDTIECIISLEKINYQNYKIVVVDNCSMDNSVAILRERFPEVIIIESKENLGFAGGNNLGIKLALTNNANYVLLLNNDTVVNENFLGNMVEAFEKNKNIGIVGGKILYYDEKEIISHAGGYIDMFRFTTVHYGDGSNKSDKLFNVEKEVGFVSGCLMLIKAEVFENIGLINEEYFMYYEDTDYCIKVLDGGYKIIYNPRAEIYHRISRSGGGADSPFFIKYNTRNRIIFMNKFRDKVGGLKFAFSKIYIYGTRIFRYLIYTIKGDEKKAGAIVWGIVESRKYLTNCQSKVPSKK